MKFKHQPLGIIHVGACNMEEADYYLSLGRPNVLWIEARPLSDEQKLRAIRNGHALKQAAFAGKTGERLLHVTDNGCSTSLLPMKLHPGVTETEQEKVNAIRADEFIARYKIDLWRFDTLVLDVQGAELEVLRGFGNLLPRLEWIISEVFYAEMYDGAPMADEVIYWLEGKGYHLQAEEKNESGMWGDVLLHRAEGKEIKEYENADGSHGPWRPRGTGHV